MASEPDTAIDPAPKLGELRTTVLPMISTFIAEKMACCALSQKKLS
jgi:hypothetical protein